MSKPLRLVAVAMSVAAMTTAAVIPLVRAQANPTAEPASPVLAREVGPLRLVNQVFGFCRGLVCLGPLTVPAGGYESNRDCGYSTAVAKDRYLWLFCDNELYRHGANAAPGDIPRLVSPFFTSNAAIATAAAPADTNVTTVAERPWPFIAASPSGQCDADWPNSYFAAWPQSATTLPDEGDLSTGKTAVVVVMFQQFCVRPGSTDPAKPPFENRSTGIASYEYDGLRWDAVPPDGPLGGLGIHGAVLSYDLFHNSDNAYGFQFGLSAAAGYLYAYRCDQVHPCELARTALHGKWNGVDRNAVATTANWSVLGDDDSWHPFDPTTKAPAATPKPLWASGSSPASDPAVVFDPHLHRYVMTYMTVGFSERAAVRTAAAPTGPWSDPVEITLPANCLEAVDPAYPLNGCYQVIAHPELDHDDQLGLTYYDVNDLWTDTGPSTRQVIGRIHRAEIGYSTLP